MRPVPPPELLDLSRIDWFTRAPEVADWMRDTFIDEGASLENEDHQHLRSASIGVLWTNKANSRHGRVIAGTCEIGQPSGSLGGKWMRGRIEQQLKEWFGSIPDFVLTFSAPYAASCTDAQFCALVEHELYHAGQERDEFGAPKFHRDGSPCFAIRGHDVEEFVGVVRRYGAQTSGVDAMIEAASKRPLIAETDIGAACGTCLARAA